jgi:DNA-binding transcriptional MerR regulator
MTTSQVAELASVRLRQLQWWDEQGICSVKIVGHQREYSAEEAVFVCIVARLRGCFTLQQIGQLSLHRALKKNEYGYLIVDGHKVWSVGALDELSVLLEKMKLPTVVVDTGLIRMNVRDYEERTKEKETLR